MTIPPHLHRLYQASIANEVTVHHAHAVRNALGGISASIFFVKSRLQREDLLRGDDRIRKSLEVIETRARDAATLANPRVLLRPTEPTEGVLSEVIDDLLASLDPPRGVRLVGPTPSPLVGKFRREELELALYCLVENAADAIASRGSGDVHIRLSAPGQNCLLEIEDDGDGIAPAIQGDIVHPFFTTKEGRLGMGLPVARRLVARLGGRLTLDGAPGRGVRASFAIVTPAGGTS